MKAASVRAGRVDAAGAGLSALQATCVVEMADARGARMRVELRGDGLAGLLALCNACRAAR
jgi:hypothetical protein